MSLYRKFVVFFLFVNPARWKAVYIYGIVKYSIKANIGDFEEGIVLQVIM